MAGRAKMFRGVLVLGGVAAPDVPAGQAHPQMDPALLHLQTLLAAGGGRFDIADLVEMGAVYLGHDRTKQGDRFIYILLAKMPTSRFIRIRPERLL